MNAMVQILVTAALVGGGIAAYHMVVADGSSQPQETASLLSERDLTDLGDRVAALEGREPVLRGSGDTQGLWDAYKRLDERLAALESGGATRTSVAMSGGASGQPSASGEMPLDGSEDVAAAGDGEPSPLSAAQEERVRALVQGERQDRMRRWGSERMDRVLEQNGIELTKAQRVKLDAATGDHFAAVVNLWRTGSSSGLDREQIMAQMGEMNVQYTQKISDFIPVRDAEAITTSLMNFGGGRGGR